MKTITKIAILLLLVYVISGCKSSEVDESKNVNQSRIYQDYYAEYDADKGKYKVEVIFRFGGTNGTTLILSEPSYVNLNGKPLEGKKQLLRGQVYFENKKANNPKDFIFEFTDLDEHTFNNTLVLESISFGELPSEISDSTGGSIYWEGKPLQEDEELWLEITDANKTAKTIFVRNQETNEVVIKPSDLQELTEGKIKLQLIRFVKHSTHENAEVGGEMSGRYYSEEAEIKIVN
jgi:hypothetical protein